MDMQLVRKGLLDYTKKRKSLVFWCAALGFSSFAAYKVYRLPSVAEKRKKFSKLLGAFVSIAELISDSAETAGVISRDLKDFMLSESDEIPNSLKQISKISRSNEVSESVVCLTQAFTLGICRGFRSILRTDQDADSKGSPSFLDMVFDKLSTPAGSGIVSVVVGTFAKNLVLGFFEDPDNVKCNGSDHIVVRVVDAMSSDKGKELVGDCVKLFVSTAIAVFLDKTMHINMFDQFFAGMTNPEHEKRVRDVLVHVSNTAVKTLVKTSHQVLTSPDPKVVSSSADYIAFDNGEDEIEKNAHLKDTFLGESKGKSLDEAKDGGWFDTVSSTLAVPSNRSFVLDVTGRVTFETIRSFLEVLLEKLRGGIKSCVEFIHETFIGSSLGAVSYLARKSSAAATLYLSLWLRILDSALILLPRELLSMDSLSPMLERNV